MIQLGIVVSIKASNRYGIVKESFVHGRQTLYHVHYIDPNTGCGVPVYLAGLTGCSLD